MRIEHMEDPDSPMEFIVMVEEEQDHPKKVKKEVNEDGGYEQGSADRQTDKGPGA